MVTKGRRRNTAANTIEMKRRSSSARFAHLETDHDQASDVADRVERAVIPNGERVRAHERDDDVADEHARTTEQEAPEQDALGLGATHTP